MPNDAPAGDENGEPRVPPPDAPAPKRARRRPGHAVLDGELREVLRQVARRPAGLGTFALVGLFLLGLFYTLYFAAGFFIPIVVALLLSFLLAPLVRMLRRARLPVPLGAAVVVLLLVGLVAWGVSALGEPAAAWMKRVPETIRTLETKFRPLKEPVEKVTRATDDLGRLAGVGADDGRSVQVASPRLSDIILDQTLRFAGGLMFAVILLYFLLASGDTFLRKVTRVLSAREHRRAAVDIVRHVQRDISRYLVTVTFINACEGTAVGLAMWALGMPAPALWGAMAATFNLVPYVGPIVSGGILTLVAVSAFDQVDRIVLVPLVFFSISTIEGYVVTPMVLSHRLMLNPVVVFVGLTFWAWMWGVVGAVVAVPLLVVLKILCDHVEPLRPVGAFMEK